MKSHPWLLENSSDCTQAAIPAILFLEFGARVPSRPLVQVRVGIGLFDAYLVPLRELAEEREHLENALEAKLGRCPELHYFKGRVDGQRVAVMAYQLDDRVMYRYPQNWNANDGTPPERLLDDQSVLFSLSYLSWLTGYKLVIHPYTNGPLNLKDIPEDEMHLHLRPWATDGHERIATHVFDKPIAAESRRVRLHDPLPGTGYTSLDPSGIPVVQAIGRVVFFLIPIVDYFHGAASSFQFRKLLMAGWNAVQRRGMRGRDLEYGAFHADTFAEAVGDTAQRALHELDRLAEVSARKVNHLLEVLTQERIRHDNILKIRNQFCAENATQDGLQERIKADALRIKSHALVTSLEFGARSMLVITQLIQAEHEGRLYSLGVFAIEFLADGNIHMYSVASTHPQRVPHPHMPHDTKPCFGSAMDALSKALAQFRLYDAFQLIVRWLRDGYEPATASCPLTEWPSEPVSKEQP